MVRLRAGCPSIRGLILGIGKKFILLSTVHTGPVPVQPPIQPREENIFPLVKRPGAKLTTRLQPVQMLGMSESIFL